MWYSAPYVILILFFTILFGVEKAYNDSTYVRKQVRIICAFIFFIFFGFRGYIGSDWFNYEISYSFTSWEAWILTDYEPGFSAIAKTFKYFNFDYFQLVAFITLLQVFFFDRFISRYSYSVSICYVILIALFPIVIIDLQRNFLSILLVMNSIPLLQNNKLWKFYFCVLLAMFFHLSAIVFFLLPFWRERIIRRYVLVTLLVLGLIVYFFQIDFYKSFLTFSGSLIGGRVEHLISQATGEGEVAYGISVGILEKIFLFITLLFVAPRLKMISPLVVNCCFIFILIYLFFSTSQSFINRFSTLFFWSYMIIYANLLFLFIRSKQNVAIGVGILMFFTMRTYLGYNNILYRYTNVLFQEENRNKRVSDREFFYENR